MAGIQQSPFPFPPKRLFREANVPMRVISRYARAIANLKTLTKKEAIMVITLGPELEAALNNAASHRGVDPEVLAINALRKQFLGSAWSLKPRDEWEKGLLEAARDCGVSLPDSALSSEGLYD